MIKKVILLITVIMLFSGFLNINIVDATEFDNVVQEAKDWIQAGESAFATAGVDVIKISDVIAPIAQALTVIGVGILLIVAAYMGIKWITANPEEQAKLKQQSVGLVVAAAVILGAYTIWTIAINIASAL